MLRRIKALPVLFALFMLSCTEDYLVAVYYTLRYDNVASPVTARLNTICFITQQTGFIGSEEGQLISTNDGGTTWVVQSQFNGAIRKILFRNTQVGYICSSGGLYRTTNGGVDWTMVEFGDFQSIAFPNAIRAIAISNEPIVTFYTNNFDGDFWNAVPPNGILNDLYDLDFETELVGYAIGDLSSTYMTTNGGASWSEANDSNHSMDLIDIYSTDSLTYVVGEEGQFQKRYDASRDGEQLSEDFLYPLFAVAFTNSAGIVVGENSIIVGDPEDDDSWEYHYAPDGSTIVGNYYDVAFRDDNVAFVVGDNGVIKKINL